MNRVAWIGPGALAVVLALLYLVSEAYQCTDEWDGYSQISALRSLYLAQEEFHKSGGEKNGVKGYWRKDVAGLYALAPDGKPLQLIARMVAEADHDPLTPLIPKAEKAPHGGWWMGTLGFPDEKETDFSRFSFCAWPSRPESGGWVFIVSQSGIVYGKDIAEPRKPDFYPADPANGGWLTREQITDRRWSHRHPWGWIQFWRR